MKSEKLYFENEDSHHCYPLQHFIDDAKLEGLKTITVLEAEPSNIDDFIWCTYYGEATEKSQCKKSECSKYSSKSGRGKCDNKGKLYNHGESITVTI